MLGACRAFLTNLGLTEVDTPMITKRPSIDQHIEVMKATVSNSETGYLHTSPEYAMKRLLAEGFHNIFYLGHVFRKAEEGSIHNPEFTMLEWYMHGIDYLSFIKNTLEVIDLFLGEKSTKHFSYKQLFQYYCEINITTMSTEQLKQWLDNHIDLETDIEDKDTILQLILSSYIESKMEKDALIIIDQFPHTQAALAQITTDADGDSVAKRFEIYYQGIEIANGYHELADSKEQAKRFEISNHARQKMGLEKLPVDEKFVAALDHIGDCYGVSLGFDRLMMLRHNLSTMATILPYSWANS